MRTILNEVNDAGRRINETLDGFRSLFGKIDQKRQPLNLNEVVLEALQSSHVELNDHGVTARTKLTSTLPPLHGDRNHLYQVVYNLIHNAVEAMSSTADPR